MKLKNLAAFLACALIWGSTFLVIRISNESLPPMWASALRLFLAAALLVGLLRATRQPFPRGPALKTASIYGLLTFGINFPLLYWGEVHVPSGLAAVLYATIPINSMLLARAFGLEMLSFRKMFAGFLALGGVTIIFWREVTHGVPALPFLAVLLAAIISSLASIVLKLGPKQSAFGSNAAGAMVGAPICLAISFMVGESKPFPSTTGQLIPLLYLTIAGSIGAFVLFAWLVNRVKVSTVSFIAVVVPVIAVILGTLVLGESFAPGSVIGALVVLAGIVLALTGNDH